MLKTKHNEGVSKFALLNQNVNLICHAELVEAFYYLGIRSFVALLMTEFFLYVPSLRVKRSNPVL